MLTRPFVLLFVAVAAPLAVAQPDVQQLPMLFSVAPTEGMPFTEDVQRYVGFPVQSLGDIDGDGRPDLLVGAAYATAEAVVDERLALLSYVVSGADGQVLHTLKPDPAGFDRRSYYGQPGQGLAPVSDLDGDGLPDVILGDPTFQQDDTEIGTAVAFSSATGEVLRRFVSPAAQEGGRFGEAITPLGDLDGGGVSDIAVSARFEVNREPQFSTGRVHVLRGEDGRTICTAQSPTLTASFASSISTADVNADGTPDLIVGDSQTRGALTESATGMAYAFDGRDCSLLRQFALVWPDAWSMVMTVEGLGDINGDGHEDIAIGTPFVQATNRKEAVGTVHVFSGLTGTRLYTIAPPNDTENVVGFGFALAPLADADGDGQPDLAASAMNGGEGVGEGYVFCGSDGALLAILAAPEDAGPAFGAGIASAGDLNGDGADEVIVGSFGGAYVFGSVRTVAEEVAAPVVDLNLNAAYPNPFAETTTLTFDVPAAGAVRLVVYDALGREVAVLADGRYGAGAHPVRFDGRALPSGIYVAQLVHGDRMDTRRLVLAR
ncbi:MAG: T9SS type A sorting domain-containing protein [Bacteroidota bacterium]